MNTPQLAPPVEPVSPMAAGRFWSAGGRPHRGKLLATIVGLTGLLAWRQYRYCSSPGSQRWRCGASARSSGGPRSRRTAARAHRNRGGHRNRGHARHPRHAGPTAIVAGLVCLAIGLVLLGVGSVALVRAVPGWWKLLTIPAALVLLLFVLYRCRTPVRDQRATPGRGHRHAR